MPQQENSSSFYRDLEQRLEQLRQQTVCGADGLYTVSRDSGGNSAVRTTDCRR